ncbi:MAG: lipid IV(A) 3-deoxy-D-manno-octulosonic acid transferase [Gammaproteobacteria bacterium]|nr:lipid IV(A) 3-deoxy-D-manno-octulosonic acid transferase [Gammaproteobacteria bacterium]NNF61444.1 3-deoxy-D-manno-octulosonic acid transferase [Gammaproteobacteria bacterium]NNM20181.1 3-deoxy-D-manno-octulosonic acid transferase [Gammaproteobacteria bacterium]
MPRLAYVLLSYLLAPFVAGFLFVRGFRNPAYWERFGERFGFSSSGPGRPSIWVHAVSVGEVQAAVPLVRQLMHNYPDIPLVITTVTPTGAGRVRDIFGDSVCHLYAPYDLPGAVRRFFDRAIPQLAIIIETELWPNLYHECGQRNVPLVLASARISPLSVSKYRRFVSLFREALSHGIVIAAQSDSDAERFRTLGANPARTHVTGNIKFDFEPAGDLQSRGTALRNEHAAGRPVWVAGSTHEGEEEQVLEALQIVRQKFPDLLLMLVPRHPERFNAVATLLQERGWSVVKRSSGDRCSPTTDVFLVDTLGELTMIYAASDFAFVGGSLVPVGGHNLLEPAALGRPILIGPHTFNAEDIAEMFIDADAAMRVNDAHDLAFHLERWLGDAEIPAAYGSRGLLLLQQNRGALQRLLSLIDPLLPRRPAS